MTLFCLVHGSTQAPSGWRRLVPELERRGHGTLLVDLPTGLTEAGADTYAGVIVKALDDAGSAAGEAVVVAHSASGIFLPLVSRSSRVRRLVYLAALIPETGRSALEQFRADPSMLDPDWVGKDPTKDDTVAEHFLFHDCAPDVLRWALTTLRLFNAGKALTEPAAQQRPDVPSTSIVCAGDRTIAPSWSRRSSVERLGVEPVELPGGHCPHVSRPSELAELLTRLGT